MGCAAGAEAGETVTGCLEQYIPLITTDSVACATPMFLRVPDAICFGSQLKVLTFEPSVSLELIVSTGSMNLQRN